MATLSQTLVERCLGLRKIVKSKVRTNTKLRGEVKARLSVYQRIYNERKDSVEQGAKPSLVSTSSLPSSPSLLVTPFPFASPSITAQKFKRRQARAGASSPVDNGTGKVSAEGWIFKRESSNRLSVHTAILFPSQCRFAPQIGGNFNQSWKRRYFALWNSTILYYFTRKEESDRFFSGGDGAAAASTSTTGFIDLSDAKSIVQLGGREGVIEIKTPSRTWYLRPETEVTTRKWSKGEVIVF